MIFSGLLAYFNDNVMYKIDPLPMTEVSTSIYWLPCGTLVIESRRTQSEEDITRKLNILRQLLRKSEMTIHFR